MKDEDGLKRVTRAERVKMQLQVTVNRFWRLREDNRAEARVGPGCCTHCGHEPCGGGWGVVFGNESARCCDKCKHLPLDGWRPTHIIWYGKKAFFVREVPVGKSGSLYLRQDGVCWFSRIGEHHYFLGVVLSPAEYSRFKVDDKNGWPRGFSTDQLGGVSPEEEDDVDEELEDTVLEDEDLEDDDDQEDEDDDDDDEELGEDEPEEDSDGIEEDEDDSGDEDVDEDEAET